MTSPSLILQPQANRNNPVSLQASSLGGGEGKRIMSSPNQSGPSAFSVHFLDADIQIYETRMQAYFPTPHPPREFAHRLTLCWQCNIVINLVCLEDVERSNQFLKISKPLIKFNVWPFQGAGRGKSTSKQPSKTQNRTWDSSP